MAKCFLRSVTLLSVFMFLCVFQAFCEHPMNRLCRLAYEQKCNDYVLPEIIYLMKNCNLDEVRAKAAYALGDFRGKEVLDDLFYMIKTDKSPMVREVTFRAIENMIRNRSLPIDKDFIEIYIYIYQHDIYKKNRERAKELLLNNGWTPKMLAKYSYQSKDYILISNMNLRERPTTRSDIVCKLKKGERFRIEDEDYHNNSKNSWYFIETKTGKKGWFCGIYREKVKFEEVSIQSEKAKQVGDESIRDPRLKKAFQKGIFQSRRIIVLYNCQTKSTLPYNSRTVRTVMNSIEDDLVNSGFRVLSPEKLQRIKHNVIDLEEAMIIGHQENGDAIITVAIDVYRKNFIVVTLKAVDLKTGELFAALRTRRSASRDAITRVAVRISRDAMDDLIGKIRERFLRREFAVLMIRDVSLPMQVKIEELLNDLGWEYIKSSHTRTYIEIKVFSQITPTSWIRFKRGMERQGLKLTLEQIKGNRIIVRRSENE